MSDRRHEIYLICAALLAAAGLILYNVFTSPQLSPQYFPASGEALTSVSSSATSQAEASERIVNINTAYEKELMSLPEIGEIRARAIVAYRNENGLFEETADIMNVEGIGESVFKSIEQLITT